MKLHTVNGEYILFLLVYLDLDTLKHNDYSKILLQTFKNVLAYNLHW